MKKAHLKNGNLCINNIYCYCCVPFAILHMTNYLWLTMCMHNKIKSSKHQQQQQFQASIWTQGTWPLTNKMKTLKFTSWKISLFSLDHRVLCVRFCVRWTCVYTHCESMYLLPLQVLQGIHCLFDNHRSAALWTNDKTLPMSAITFISSKVISHYYTHTDKIHLRIWRIKPRKWFARQLVTNLLRDWKCFDIYLELKKKKRWIFRIEREFHVEVNLFFRINK